MAQSNNVKTQEAMQIENYQYKTMTIRLQISIQIYPNINDIKTWKKNMKIKKLME